MNKSADRTPEWLLPALLVPVADAAGNTSWATAVLMGAGVCILLWYLPAQEETWHPALRWILLTILTAHFLHSTYSSWPGKGTQYAVPLVLLLLAMLASDLGEEKASAAGNALRWAMVLPVGAILLSVVSSLQYAVWKPEFRKPEGNLPLLLALMVLARKESRKQAMGYGAYAAAASFLVSGITMGRAGLYEVSRSISILGMSERLESITAAALTLGHFVLLTWILCESGKEWISWRKGSAKTGSRACAAAAGMWYLLGIQWDGIILAGTVLVMWRAGPNWMRKKMKKDEKRC